MVSRRPDHLGKRKEFSALVKRQARERAGGVCQYPGCNQPAHEVDHILPQGLGGDSSLSTAQVLCDYHHKQKTALDTKIMAKADRQGMRSGQQARRKKNGSKFWKPPGYVSPLNSKSKNYRKRKVGA